MPKQLSFDLPSRPALGRNDFFVSPANAMAVATVDSWRSWPNGKLVLTGPAGAGKTHLASVWASDTQAQVLDAADLAQADILSFARGPLVVEDVDKIAGDVAAEHALFHVHNLMREVKQPLLLTGSSAPSLWPLLLPDLASRMQGTTVIALDQPDDALLTAVVTKLFADRQLNPTPAATAYLTTRIDRSFEAAGRIVAAIDREALSERRRITRKFAAKVLERLEKPAPSPQ